MTLHETVSGAARQKPGNSRDDITGNNRMPDRARRSLARMPIQMRTMPSALLRPAGHRAGKPMHIRGGRGDLRNQSRIVGQHVVLLRQQRAQHAGQHIARTGGGHPGRRAPGQDDPRVPISISSNHNGDRALKQHRGPRKLMRAQRRPQWPGLHPLPGNNIGHIGIQPIQQCGQFAGMRSDNDLRHNMARQQIQRAGINHNGRHALRPLVPRAIAILQRVMIQQRGNGRTLHVITGSNVTLGGHTGSNHPRLHPALAQHSLRQHGQYHILRTLWPQITHHAHIRARRGPCRQHGSTRIPRRTSHQTNHSTRILAIRKRRKTNRIRHKIAIRHLGKRNSIIDIETEIDQRDPSASIRSRRHHRTRLHRTERHRHIRRNIRPRQRTIINTHTRRRIDSHHQRQISGRVIVRQRRLVRQHAIHTQRRSQRASDTTQRAGHANPRHSIKHHMRTPRTLDRSLQPLTSLTRGKTRRAPRNISRRIQHQHTPTRTNKLPKRILMQRTANSNRGNLRTLTRQLSPRIQAIATIVPSASQHRDPRILNIQILIIKQRQRHTSHRRSSHTHQRHTIIQQRTL